MASENVREFTDDNFQNEVLDAETPVLVDFWAEWCQPCKLLAPHVETVADQFADKVRVGKLDTDSNRDTAVKYGISAIPTVIVFKGGEEKKRLIGLKTPQELAKAIVKQIKDAKMKVQASIQGDLVRVSGKKRDDLQAAIALLKEKEHDRPLQYVNFRD